MRLIIQRTTHARVSAGTEIVGEINTGFMVLVGITHTDTQKDADYLAKKLAGLRIFEDSEGKMNCSLADVKGSVLSISQFTLYGDCRKGNRPGFTQAARSEQAKLLYDYFNQVLRTEYHLSVQTGIFGAMMQVDFINDGPTTLIIDSL